MKKAILGVSMLLASTCVIAQEPSKSRRPMETPTKQAPPTAQETARPGAENKNNATIFKGDSRKQTNRDADKTSGRDSNEKAGNGGAGKTGNGGAGKSSTTNKNSTQRDRPRDIPN